MPTPRVKFGLFFATELAATTARERIAGAVPAGVTAIQPLAVTFEGDVGAWQLAGHYEGRIAAERDTWARMLESHQDAVGVRRHSYVYRWQCHDDVPGAGALSRASLQKRVRD